MRRLKKDEVVEIDRPFCIWVEPDINDSGQWIATICGHNLDNVTFDYSPADAVSMAAELLRMLTGRCKAHDQTPHDWSIDTVMENGGAAWECSRCGDMAAKDSIEEADSNE